jgi:hypothetical protein
MVFIEERHQFLKSLDGQPKQMALYALVSDENLTFPDNELSETDRIYYSSIQAIKKNSKKDFSAQYSKISKRKVSENSSAPFIHDDFLIYALIIGVIKFDCDKNWLLGIINNRAKGDSTTTFENLLNENYQSKANNQSIVLTLLFLLDKSKLSNELLTDAYQSMCDANQSFKNDFNRIIHYRAFDIIIKYKLPNDVDKVSRLLNFEARFLKRINIFTYIVYNMFLIVLLFAAYKSMQALPDDIKSKINDIGIIIGIGGIGLLGNIIPILRKKFKELTLRVFGYI